MTAYSLFILTCPEGASAEQLERSNLGAEVIRNLDEFARDYGPRVNNWAESRGLPLYYVDSCWVRAAVTGRDLKCFDSEVLGGKAKLDGFAPDGRYLIEAEEF